MNTKLYYKSKLTQFQTTEPPYTDKIYFKNCNKTVCIIHIEPDWSMYGEVLDPFNIPIDLLTPKFRNLTQYECEELLMWHMPPLNRVDVLKRWNMPIMDYAQLLYRTRLITYVDNYWAAWSEEDKAEDYHPRFNKEIFEERYKDVSFQFDDYENTPLWKPDFEKESYDYHEDIEDEFKDLIFSDDEFLVGE